MKLPYNTIKEFEWDKLLLVIVGILLIWQVFFKAEPSINVGYSEEDVQYKLQINTLQLQLNTKIEQYEALEMHVQDFKAQLDSNHAFFGSATDAQVDSSFANYFDLRHDEVLHVRTGPSDNRGSKLDSNKR